MSDYSEAVQRLASTAFDDDGWMSDAQDARLEWDEVNQSLHFCGEGSVDVGHMVSLVLADQGKPSPPNPLPESGGHRPQRLNAKLRASLIDFAKDRIQAVWNDVGETDAATLAENVVSAQEFAWLSAQVPIVTDERVEAGARALSPNAWVDGAWITSTRQADAQRYATRRARAVLEAALGGEA